jgi:hypothetical protein
MKKTIASLILFASVWLVAERSEGQSQQPPKEKQGPVTVEGCVSRASGEFTLIQPDASNTYVLRASGKVKLDPYLGQQVEVSGSETPSMGTSANRGRPASPVTIVVDSIKTISKRCGS